MRKLFNFSVIVWAAFATAALPNVVSDALEADIVVLGEVHDNPDHHKTQATWVGEIKPAAIVFEMISPDEATRLTPEILRDAKLLASTLNWEENGWPDFEMYFPIFTAAPDADIFGAAVRRSDLMALRDTALEDLAGALAGRFALDQPLPEAQNEARLELQHIAHCEAMPAEFLPMMVNAQRLRDATLADAALTALDQTGGPVIVITGNGHARKDWGVPYLISLASDALVFSLGQAEDGRTPDGGFDAVVDAPAVNRPDPCAAFR